MMLCVSYEISLTIKLISLASQIRVPYINSVGNNVNILCQFVPVFMYVSYQSDSSFLSSLLHHGHFLVFYQTSPSHNKMHQQA